jgi:hypothetical protein
VDGCGSKVVLFLARSTFGEISQLSEAKLATILSYRWKEVVNVSCHVHAPGEEPTATPRKCALPIDAFRARPATGESVIWTPLITFH